jgi:bifunctional non-homologous end joining protein LigD
MALEEYKKKRKFEETPEPSGDGKADGGPLLFVVQKHKASRLHFDFRLELNGTLKSWAIPKGPSMNPADKRLAVMVEDHPLDYRSFEGVIPEGNYGGGTVMVWDEGNYGPFDAPTREDAERILSAALEKGHLTFVLNGKKLKGEFALVKLRKGGENDWLMIKANDDLANTDDVQKQDKSILSGRSMDEITAESVETGDVWGSAPDAAANIDLSDAPEAPMPHKIKPMLSTPVEEPFDRKDWIFEIKWDGYRAIAEVAHGDVKLYSRNDQPLNQQYPPIVEALAGLGVEAVFDGEVVVVDEKGVSRFEMLQNYRQSGGRLIYYVFDLLWLNGHDLRELPLKRRKEILASFIPKDGPIRLSSHIDEAGCSFFEAATAQGLEGIIAKDGSSPYRVGVRNREWIKIKARLKRNAVIGGFTEPRGGRQHLGALILGAYQGDELVYIGHTGGGSDDKVLRELRTKLDPLIQDKSPFKNAPKPNAPVHWVEPKLVCGVLFTEMTSEGILRQPILQGLKKDVPPDEVTLEAVVADVEVQQDSAPDVHVGSHQDSDSKEPEMKKTEKLSDGKLELSGKSLRLTNLSKVYWPDDGYTKGDLVAYYKDVAQFMLPHLEGRPESLNRFPNGINQPSFYQKDITDKPDWATTVKVRSDSEDKEITYFVVEDEAALVYLANLGCIEMNPWLSRMESLDNPDFLVIDLDPEGISFDEVVRAALVVKEILDAAGATSVVKTSGASGMHIYVPLGAAYNYDQARMFAEVVAQIGNQRLPETTSVARMPAKRPDRVYLDYLQNRRGQTLAAPYSVRPRPGATVSTPLSWDEVKPGLDPTKFTIRNTMKRLERLGDIFIPALGQGIELAKCLDKMVDVIRSKAA